MSRQSVKNSVFFIGQIVHSPVTQAVRPKSLAAFFVSIGGFYMQIEKYILCIPIAFFLLAASFLHKAIVAENNNWRVYAIVLMILSLSFVVILMIWMSNDSFV